MILETANNLGITLRSFKLQPLFRFGKRSGQEDTYPVAVNLDFAVPLVVDFENLCEGRNLSVSFSRCFQVNVDTGDYMDCCYLPVSATA